MKVRFTSGRLSVEVEGEKQKDIFQQIASFQEVFEHNKCLACQCEETRFVVRIVEDNDFYEMHCTNKTCLARLAFGQHKSKAGTLFPKRKDQDGKWLPNNGWVKFDPSTIKKDN